jgi:hypothetical protein
MLFALLTRFLALPRWVHFVLAGAGLALAFALWLRIHDAGVRNEQKRLDRAEYEQALAEAELLAIKARADAEAESRRKANVAQASHDAEMSRAVDLAAAYKRANRLHTVSGQGASCQAIATSRDSGSSLPESPASAAVMVAVSEEDVNACTGAAVYARQAFEWARGL